jgi:phenylalanyl-tRNA synthetase beta chain
LFDIYRGKGIAEGSKSLAFGLIFQDFSSNLTDSRVEAVVSDILSGLERTLGATLRV